MSRSIRTAALAVWLAFATTPVLAQTVETSGPPAWQDGESAYLVNQGPPTNNRGQQQTAAAAEYGTALPLNPPFATNVTVDRAVVPTAHAAAIPSDDTQADRYLAAPSDATHNAATLPPGENLLGPRDLRPVGNLGVPPSSLYTVACALAIVIGAFLVCVWLLRRGTASAAAALPAEVVSVLGRVPLAPRQFAQLLRVGNKLVLISLSPSGAETITEVTDLAEVDRLAGLCQQSNPHSTTKVFEQVFQQLAHERVPSGFFGSDPLPPTLSPPAELGLFRTPRVEAARG